MYWYDHCQCVAVARALPLAGHAAGSGTTRAPARVGAGHAAWIMTTAGLQD